MNKIYSKVWNKSLGMLVVASEFARANGKGSGSKRLRNAAAGIVIAGAIVTSPAYAAGVVCTLTGTAANAPTANGTNALACGDGAEADGNDSVALGANAYATTDSSTAIGSYARATAANALALGANSVAGVANTVSVGHTTSDIDPSTGVAYTSALTRQISNVASGGTITTNAANIGDVQTAAVAATTEVQKGTNVTSVVKTTAGDGHAIYTVNADNSTVSAAPGGGVTVTAGVKNASNVTDYSVDLGTAAKTSLGKADSAVQSFTTAVSGTNAQTVNQQSGTNQANFVAGSNIQLTGSSTGITIATKPNVVFTSVTTGNAKVDNSGLTITGGPKVISSGIDAGSNKVTGVADGSVASGSKEAVNGGQLYDLKDSLNVVGAGVKYFHANSTLDDSVATGVGSIAIGPEAVASSDDGLAAGHGATIDATSTGAIAVGLGATIDANSARTIAIGKGAKSAPSITPATPNASANDGVALGTSAQVVGDDAVSIGHSTSAGGAAVGLGLGANASGGSAVGIGHGVSASGGASVGVGNNALASAGSGVAIGNGAQARMDEDIAIGKNAGLGSSGTVGTDTQSIYIGSSAGAGVINGGREVAIGYQAGMGRGDNSDQNIAMGEQAGLNQSGRANVAIGQDAGSKANASTVTDETVSIGHAAQTSDSYAVAVGPESYANGASATTLGYNTLAVGGNSLAIGANARANYGNSVAIGGGSIADQALDSVTSPAYLTTQRTDYSLSVGAAPVGGNAGVTRRISNVAGGFLGNDAVNVSQLKAVQGSVAGLVGGGVTVQANGAFSPITVKDSGGTDHSYNTVVDALGAISSGSISTLPPSAVTFDNDGNVNVKNGRITNVGTATAASDAVNLGQVNGAISAAQTHYVSINSTDTPNRDNSSATGSDAIAVGVKAEAPGDHAVALGSTATAGHNVGGAVIGNSAIAIGYTADVRNDYGISVGVHARTLEQDATAIGHEARADGEGSVSLGHNAQVEVVSNVSADDGIAIGTDSHVTADQGTAIGNQAQAYADQSQAFGNMAHADQNAVRGVAMGDHADTSQTDSYAIGTQSSGDAADGFAIGSNAATTGASSYAIGNTAKSRGVNSFAVGSQAQTDVLATNSQAIGTSAQTYSPNGIAFGNGAVAGDAQLPVGAASGSNIAMGTAATAKGDHAIAIGSGNSIGAHVQSVLNGNYSAALGNDNTIQQDKTFVVGNSVTTTQANSVVLGNASKDRAATAEAAVSLNGDNYSYAGVGSAAQGVVSVGSKGAERQVINVAAGNISQNSTDAVNGSQLYATNQAVQKPITFAGDSGTNVKRTLNQTLNVQGGQTNASKLTANNIGVVADGTDTLDVRLAKDIDLGSTGSVTTGNTVINNGGVTIGTGGTAVSLGSSGLSNGGKTISNVASGGTTTTNAANIGDVQKAAAKATSVVAAGTNVASVGTTTAADGHATYTVNADGSSVSAGSSAVAVTKGTANSSNVTDYAVDLSAATKTSLGKADSAVQSFTTVADGATAETINKTSNQANFKSGDNITLTGTSTGITVATKPDVAFTSVTTGNTVMNTSGVTIGTGASAISLTNTGLDNGGNKIAHVAAGTSATDAVNLSQLQDNAIAVRNAAPVVYTNAAGAPLTKAGDGKWYLASAVKPDGSLIGTPAEVATTAVIGSLQNADGTTSTPMALANVGAGAISASSTQAVNGSQLHSTNQTLATALGGGSTLDSNGAITAPSYSLPDAGNPGSNKPYSNVGDALTGLSAAGVNFQGDQSSAAGNVHHDLGGTLALNGGVTDPTKLTANNIGVIKNASGDGYDIQLAQDVDLGTAGSVTAGNTVVDNGGVTINGGASPVSLTTTGLNNGGNTITGVANGAVNSTSTDAVNGSQLQALATVVGANKIKYFSVNSTAGGNLNNDGATGEDAIAIGKNASAAGVRQVAVGLNAGSGSTGNLNAAVGDGAGSNVSSQGNAAFGTSAGSNVTATTTSTVNPFPFITGQNVGVGASAGSGVGGNYNTAVGERSGRTVDGNGNAAFGSIAGNGVNGSVNVAVGPLSGNTVIGNTNTAVGNFSGTTVTGSRNAAFGASAGGTVTGSRNAAFGSSAGGTVTGSDNVAVGSSAGRNVTASNTVSVGNTSLANADSAIAIGNGAQATANNAIAVGSGNMVSGANSGAIGNPNSVSGSGSYAVGNNNNLGATSNNTFVVGNAVTTTQANSVVLGNASTDRAATTVTGDTIDGTAYTYAGAGSAVNGVVSVGAAGKQRQLINVASGDVSGSSTDAVNGSQLFATNTAVTAVGTRVTNLGNSTAAGLGGTSSYNAGTGALTTALTVGGNNYNNVNSALTAVNSTANKGFNLSANGGTAANVAPGGTVDVSSSSTGNIKVTQTGTNLAIETNPDLKATSVTTGNTVQNTAGITINDGTNPAVSLTSTGLDNGGNTISNVGDGALSTTSKDAVNGSQLNTTNTNVATNAGSIANVGGAVTSVAAGLGGGASYDAATNTYTAPSYTTNNADGTTSTVNNVGDALASINSQGIKYFHANSTGADSQALGVDSVAIGAAAVANNAADVALGSNSTTRATTASAGTAINGTNYTFAGNTPTAALSVGGRQIQDVAAGQLSGSSTDAVNGSQLYATNQAVDAAAATANNSVQYDDASKTRVTMAGPVSADGGVTGGTRITNVSQGDVSDGSTDAVNGTQLNDTNTNVATNATNIAGNTTAITVLGGRVTTLETTVGNIGNGSVGMFQVSQDHNTPPPAPTGLDSAAGGANATASGNGSVAIGNNSTASGTSSSALGNGSKASGTGSTAVGQGASASAAGSVALGNGASDGGRGGESYVGKYSGAQNDSVGTVSVGNAATGDTRTVSNVADGQQATDAVNVRQLDGAVQVAKTYTDTQISNVNTSVSTLGAQVAGNSTDIANIQKGADGMFQVSADANSSKPQATGTNSAAAGNNAVTSGNNGTAVGNDTVASGEASTALGNGAQATGDNSVAIGAGSVSTRGNSVSVGSAGNERQVTNVAAGTEGTDAVNVTQLKATQSGSVQYDKNADGSNDYSNVTMDPGGNPTVIHNVGPGTANNDVANVGQLNAGVDKAIDWSRNYTDQRFNSLDQKVNTIGNRANGGIASSMAMASLPQAYQPNQSSASVALGNFHGETGIAVGVSTITESGRYVFKLNATTNTRGDAGVGVGAGMVW